MFNVKLTRIFYGEYVADTHKLALMGYVQMRLPRPYMMVSSSEHGNGRIEGMVRQDGVPYKNLKIQVFNRNTKTLIWQTTTAQDGRFKFRNIAVGLECYVMVFDPLKEKNAKVKDLIIAR